MAALVLRPRLLDTYQKLRPRQRWMITWSADDKINTADVWDDFDGWAKQKWITEKIGKQKFFKWLQSIDGVSRSENGRVFTGLRPKTVWG